MRSYSTLQHLSTILLCSYVFFINRCEEKNQYIHTYKCNKSLVLRRRDLKLGSNECYKPGRSFKASPSLLRQVEGDLASKMIFTDNQFKYHIKINPYKWEKCHLQIGKMPLFIGKAVALQSGNFGALIYVIYMR